MISRFFARRSARAHAFVKAYVTTMFRKLNVTNRTQALVVAQALLVQTEPVN